MVNKKFNDGIGNGVRSTYDCCYKCTERFPGDKTRPNCHTVCKKYLEAHQLYTEIKEKVNAIKFNENTATSASVSGIKRMKTHRKSRNNKK